MCGFIEGGVMIFKKHNLIIQIFHKCILLLKKMEMQLRSFPCSMYAKLGNVLVMMGDFCITRDMSY